MLNTVGSVPPASSAEKVGPVQLYSWTGRDPRVRGFELVDQHIQRVDRFLRVAGRSAPTEMVHGLVAACRSRGGSAEVALVGAGVAAGAVLGLGVLVVELQALAANMVTTTIASALNLRFRLYCHFLTHLDVPLPCGRAF